MCKYTQYHYYCGHPVTSYPFLTIPCTRYNDEDVAWIIARNNSFPYKHYQCPHFQSVDRPVLLDNCPPAECGGYDGPFLDLESAWPRATDELNEWLCGDVQAWWDLDEKGTLVQWESDEKKQKWARTLVHWENHTKKEERRLMGWKKLKTQGEKRKEKERQRRRRQRRREEERAMKYHQ